MTPTDSGPAAPNRSRLTANVLRVERSAQWPDKWLLEIEIIAATPLHGGQFAHAGQRARAFAIADAFEWTPGTRIRALAEYLGGPSGGQFKLEDIELAPDPP